MALERGHPELVGRYLLNPDLPPPGDLGPLLGTGKVDYGAVARVHAARVLHVLSPFELGVPIGASLAADGPTSGGCASARRSTT